jgi:preprotein translocase subunit SecG
MQTILTVLHLFLALGLIGLVLIQHGKGADMGAAFGSGASATVFGARGSGNFLSRSTAVIATLFFVTSMVLAYFAAQTGEPEGLMDGLDEVPAASTTLEPGGEAVVDEVPPPVPATEGGSDIPPPEPAPAPTAADVPPPAAAGGAESGAPAGQGPSGGQ